METVRVEKKILREALVKNRNSHRSLFEQAQEGHRKVVINLLDKAIQDAKANKKIQTYFNVQAPCDHTSDYDRVIEMLKWSVDDVVELSQGDFAQYVMDDWGWKEDFLSNALCYTKVGK